MIASAHHEEDNNSVVEYEDTDMEVRFLFFLLFFLIYLRNIDDLKKKNKPALLSIVMCLRSTIAHITCFFLIFSKLLMVHLSTCSKIFHSPANTVVLY